MVSFCFARHRLLSKSMSEDDITALYITSVKQSLGPFQAATLDAAIDSNRTGFAALLWSTRIANFDRSYKSLCHMDIDLFAGKFEQWRLPGDPARSSDIDVPAMMIFPKGSAR